MHKVTSSNKNCVCVWKGEKETEIGGIEGEKETCITVSSENSKTVNDLTGNRVSDLRKPI